MNSLSHKEISGQLFYLSKESIKTIVLNSKCGLLAQVRASKKPSINDISILNNFSPLLCLYKKASPMFIHSKTSHGFDESSFKKEINPSTNAFMTLCLLELSEYYSHYDEGERNVVSLEKPFKYLAKEQLQFYSENLRNDEGLFVDKKNISDGNSKGFSLIDKDSKFKFSDQAFMMDVYFLYAHYNKFDHDSDEYIKFSYEILDMFKNYKSVLYDLSFSENAQIFFALNLFYRYSHNKDAKNLILDLGDFLISKFQEKDHYLDSIDDCALFCICLMEAYKHTDIISFKDSSKEIAEKLISLYDSDKNIFIKPSDKKEIKYSCVEINNYLLCLIMYSLQEDKITELRPIISGLYRKFFVNNGLLTSWPEAPTLDEVERYKKLSLRSDDMLDETYFRMPILATPKSTGLAPIFIKNLVYSKKKDSLSPSKNSFDSNKNMFNFLLIIHLFKDSVEEVMNFTCSNLSKEHTLNDTEIIEGTKIENNLSLEPNELPSVDNSANIVSDTSLSSTSINAISSKKNLCDKPEVSISNLESKSDSSCDLEKNTKSNLNNLKESCKPVSNNKTTNIPKKKFKKNKAQHPSKKKKK